MTPGSVARRYARALYELAVEDRAVVQVGELLRAVAQAVGEVGSDALAEGVLDLEDRRKLARTLAAKVGPETTFGKFLSLVAERDRLARLPEIADWYGKLEDEAAGRVQLAITAAGELAAADVDAIRAAFRSIAKREVVTNVSTDPSLLGGAIVELEGRVYDGSVKTALARLSSRMAGTTNGAGATQMTAKRERKRDADQSV
jgi:F-type H+-transporting ATPase subunit delta